MGSQKSGSVSLPPQMPDSVRSYLEKNPDVLSTLLHPESVQALAGVSADADWCVACGASSGRAPQRPALDSGDPFQLTDAQIDAIAQRVIDLRG
jgi:hypothetical protein